MKLVVLNSYWVSELGSHRRWVKVRVRKVFSGVSAAVFPFPGAKDWTQATLFDDGFRQFT